MRNRIHVHLLCYCLCVFVLPVHAGHGVIGAQPQDVDEIFARGVILYNNGKYEEAFEVFSLLARENQENSRLTASLLMRAKTSYLLKSYKNAQEDLRRLLVNYPGSRYVDHAHLLAGLIFFQKQDLPNAAKRFLWAVDNARDERVRQKGAEIAEILLNYYLTSPQIEQLLEEVKETNSRALIVEAAANQQFQKGNIQEARGLISNYLSANPASRYNDRLQNMLQDDKFRRTGTNRVGVIMPLNTEEGRGLYRGIKYAEMRFKEGIGAQTPVELIVRDSESSMIRAVQHMQGLVRDPNVVGVIGEIDEYISAGLAGMAQVLDLPFIAPSVTDDGFAEIGDNIFQLVPDLEIQAQTLAAYAVDSLGLRRFVTLAPQDEYGRQMVDAFSLEVDKRGGMLVAQSWYYGIPENLGKQFKQIREAAFRLQMEDTLKFRLPNFATLNKDSLWRVYNTRLMIENNLNEPIVEMTGRFPVRNIDAIFLPIYTEDIQYIARQLAYYNISTRILGSEKWYQIDLNQDRNLLRYIDGAVLVSSYYLDPNNFNYRNFRNQFRTSMGVTPERWEALGYDAAAFLLQSIANGGTNRSSLRDILGRGTQYRGIKGEIRLNAYQRVNQAVHLLQIRSTSYQKLN